MLKLNFEAMTVGLLNDELREYVGALAGSNCGTLLADEDGKIMSPDGVMVADVASTKSVILAGKKLGQTASGLNIVKAASDEIKSEEKPVVEEKAEPATEGRGDVVVTLETLSAVPYDMLLAFCAQNPDVNVNVEKHSNPYFRTMVESRVKTFLTK